MMRGHDARVAARANQVPRRCAPRPPPPERQTTPGVACRIWSEQFVYSSSGEWVSVLGPVAQGDMHWRRRRTAAMQHGHGEQRLHEHRCSEG